MQDYNSLRAAVIIHDNLVNTQTDTHTLIALTQSGFPLYFGIEIQGLFKDFQGPCPAAAFSRTNSRRKFTAWTVLQQYLISISVITGQF